MDCSKSKRKSCAQRKAEKEKSSLQASEPQKELATKKEHVGGGNHPDESSNAPSSTSSCRVFSADMIMRLARARLNLMSLTASHFETRTRLPSEVSEDLELAQIVQASAEKVASGNFASARRLLRVCDDETLKEGSPVQRTVYYFSEALKERIEGKNRKLVDEEQAISLRPSYMSAQQELPFSLTTGCTAVQSILDTVTIQKKIHLIDFGINNGSRWTIIMQALAARTKSPLQLLKITAVGTCEGMMKEIGNKLSCFAESLNIRFSFKIVVSDLKDLKEGMLELEADEALVVYMALRIYTRLEDLLGLIKNLTPCLILLREVEVSTNLPNFMEQFNEALLFFSALFDCVKVCMKNQLHRKVNEEYFFASAIRNVIAANGSERIYHERIDGWRTLFARYNIVESELSLSSLHQAKLLLKSSDQWSSCSLDMDGKCLIISWNETRMISLSAWKPLQSP